MLLQIKELGSQHLFKIDSLALSHGWSKMMFLILMTMILRIQRKLKISEFFVQNVASLLLYLKTVRSGISKLTENIFQYGI